MNKNLRSLLVVLCGFCLAAGPKLSDRSRTKVRPVLELKSPMRVTASGRRTLLVSDHAHRKVLLFHKKDLTFKKAITVSGKPLAVAWIYDQLVVGDATSGYVDFYDDEGNWLHRLGDPPAKFTKPTDMAFAESERLLFVVDGPAKIVRIFSFDSRNGTEVGTIPSEGSDPNQLAHPTGICVDPIRREVLISDFGKPEAFVPPRIQVYDFAGQLVQTISGQQGWFGFRFSRPQGLAVDREGHVFVVGSLVGRVFALDRATGATLMTFGEYGPKPGQLSLPLDVHFDARSRILYVTSNRSSKIEAFPTAGLIP